jgi:hypothetical protein
MRLVPRHSRGGSVHTGGVARARRGHRGRHLRFLAGARHSASFDDRCSGAFARSRPAGDRVGGRAAKRATRRGRLAGAGTPGKLRAGGALRSPAFVTGQLVRVQLRAGKPDLPFGLGEPAYRVPAAGAWARRTADLPDRRHARAQRLQREHQCPRRKGRGAAPPRGRTASHPGRPRGHRSQLKDDAAVMCFDWQGAPPACGPAAPALIARAREGCDAARLRFFVRWIRLISSTMLPRTTAGCESPSEARSTLRQSAARGAVRALHQGS